jgi:hypothetical protein
MHNLDILLKLLRFMPSNYLFMKRIFGSFSNLHVEDGIVYSLPLCNVHELRGNSLKLTVTLDDSKCLFDLTATLSEPNSFLGILAENHVDYMNNIKYVVLLFDLHADSHVIYMLFTCYLHVIYTLFTCYSHLYRKGDKRFKTFFKFVKYVLEGSDSRWYLKIVNQACYLLHYLL